MSEITPDDATALRPAGDSRSQSGQHRFAPGAVLLDRYRIISMVGSGGMGEVYRADDLKLGQQVALKFLPRNIEADAVERLYGEVRVGRQISHPNVCRLYDVGEANGHHFITMEFVDGEDLASLLRRIGHLPAEKAVAITRDICAGLAAAHDRGVIHRDLKPANIMIDGRGSARITDFGLAAIAEDVGAASDAVGTPAYMAPEQLAGGALTPRTDIYALGVVLYEMFTGRRLFSGRTINELRNQHATSKTRPSSVVSGLDPAVERVILRCLEEEPQQRPASMASVIAALPGGDPLMAAIAAGETPSPQMVAAAGDAGDISAGRAWLLLAAFVATLVLGAWAEDRASVLGYVTGMRSRDALEDRAASVIASLGYPAGSDHASWYSPNSGYLAWARRSGTKALHALRSAPPGAVLFSYRQRDGQLTQAVSDAPVNASNPPANQPGDTWVQLDHQGRLREFSRVPAVNVTEPPASADWSAAFREAGLDPARVHAAAPQATPDVGSDRRYAWSATWAARPDLPLRVEAASVGGRPVFFRVVEPWPRFSAAGAYAVGRTFYVIIVLGVLIAVAIIARLNTARGRGDTRGARRIFVGTAICFTAGLLANDHHVANAGYEYQLLVDSLAQGLFLGMYGWLAYLAVEPYVRRRWPKILIASSRFLAGRVRDPLVGRDVLAGLTAGTAVFALDRSVRAMAVLGGIANPLLPISLASSSRMPVAHVLMFNVGQGLIYTLGYLASALLIRRFTKSEAAVYALLPFVLAMVMIGNYGWVDFGVGLLAGIAGTFILLRAGALTAVASTFAWFVLRQTPVTLRMGEPYATIAVGVVVALVALAGGAFWLSLGGKPLFGTFAVEDEAVA